MSNLIGLDEQVAVDGNEDRIERSSFSLTPTLAKSSKKGTKKQQSKLPSKQPPPATTRKRLFDGHRDAVSNVKDLRLKRGRVEKEQDGDECVIVDPEAVEYVPNPSKESTKQSSVQTLVTPSPHPRANGNSNGTLTPVRNAASASNRGGKPTQSSRAASGPQPNKYTATQRKGPRNGNRSSWFQEKRNVKQTQQTAFNSPKENPFATYAL